MAYRLREAKEESQSRNLEAGTEVEALQEGTWRQEVMESHSLPACSPWFAYTTQDHLPRGGTAAAGWALPR